MRVHSRSGPVCLAALLACSLLPAAVSCTGSGRPSGEKGEGSAPVVRDAVDACQMLTREEIAQAVGNPVKEGVHNVGSHLCNWDSDTLEDVSVVLTVWAAGEPAMASLCDSVRAAATPEAGFAGLGEAARWSYRSSAAMGSSADLELCDPKAWLGLSLAGKRDEAALREAARGLASKVLERL